MATRIRPPAPSPRDPEVEALQERVRKLEKINAALIDRVERSTDIHGGAFSMFENAIALEAMVRDRTLELEEALGQLGTANAALEIAHGDTESARRRLRDAIESLGDGFALFDAEDRMVMCNRAFMRFWPEVEEIAGNQPSFTELAERLAENGRTIGALVSADRWVRERIERHRAAGTHVQPLSDGRWLQINELRTSEGGTVGIYTDITSVKAEDARERAKELAARNLALQSTLDTLSEGACLFDSERRLQAWNGGLADMLKLDAGVLSAIPTHDAFAAHCLAEGLDRPQAVEWRDGRGPRISSECLIGERHFVIRSVTLATGGMAFALDDVTDRIRFQRSLTETAETLEKAVKARTAELTEVNHQLVEARDEAERANRSKTQFLAAASHDLLQPLNAARLFVSALGERRLSTPTRGLVSQAAVALDSVEELLEALFEISRLDAGAIQPEIGAIALDRILTALRIEFAPLARSGGLEFSIPETGLWVRSDMRMLRRILQNFVSNAIRYTDTGTVTVHTEADDAEVVIAIRDTGPGISLENQNAIFDEFRRLEGSRRRPGNGLGLAIVRRTAAMLGHSIGLDSRPGEGAVFSIRVPRAAPSTATSERGAVRTRGAVKQGGVVLVIDNDERILEGMRALLGHWGVEMVTAAGPGDPQAKAAARSGPALIVADYHLDDGLTGDRAIARLRALHDAEIPAVIITADRSEEVKAQLAAAGLPTLTKPIKPAQLRALLRQLTIAP